MRWIPAIESLIQMGPRVPGFDPSAGGRTAWASVAGLAVRILCRTYFSMLACDFEIAFGTRYQFLATYWVKVARSYSMMVKVTKS